MRYNMSMAKKSKLERYLDTIDEATNLLEAADVPPSRIREILKKVLKDYFYKKIDEQMLNDVGSLLHESQVAAWDTDTEITGITCCLDDMNLDNTRIQNKKERDKLYRECLKTLSENETISVSIPIKNIKKLEKLADSKMPIDELIQTAVNNFLKNK
jgi:hypothetical protein